MARLLILGLGLAGATVALPPVPLQQIEIVQRAEAEEGQRLETGIFGAANVVTGERAAEYIRENFDGDNYVQIRKYGLKVPDAIRKRILKYVSIEFLNCTAERMKDAEFYLMPANADIVMGYMIVPGKKVIDLKSEGGKQIIDNSEEPYIVFAFNAKKYAEYEWDTLFENNQITPGLQLASIYMPWTGSERIQNLDMFALGSFVSVTRDSLYIYYIRIGFKNTGTQIEFRIKDAEIGKTVITHLLGYVYDPKIISLTPTTGEYKGQQLKAVSIDPQKVQAMPVNNDTMSFIAAFPGTYEVDGKQVKGTLVHASVFDPKLEVGLTNFIPGEGNVAVNLMAHTVNGRIVYTINYISPDIWVFSFVLTHQQKVLGGSMSRTEASDLWNAIGTPTKVATSTAPAKDGKTSIRIEFYGTNKAQKGVQQVTFNADAVPMPTDNSFSVENAAPSEFTLKQ